MPPVYTIRKYTCMHTVFVLESGLHLSLQGSWDNGSLSSTNVLSLIIFSILYRLFKLGRWNCTVQSYAVNIALLQSKTRKLVTVTYSNIELSSHEIVVLFVVCVCWCNFCWRMIYLQVSIPCRPLNKLGGSVGVILRSLLGVCKPVVVLSPSLLVS